MAEKKPTIDLSRLKIPFLDIRELVSHILFYEDKKHFFQLLQEKKFEEDKSSENAEILETAVRKLENNKIRELSPQECPLLLKYVVDSLGAKFFDVYAKVIENQLQKSLAKMRSGIIAQRSAEITDEINSNKVIQFFQRMNKEVLLKWIFFLDNLPSVSRDEMEEAEVRNLTERITDCFCKVTIKGEELKSDDWRIIKNCIHYFGGAASFRKEAQLPENTYHGILPFAVDSLSLGIGKGVRTAFLRKTVEEKLSVTRPPVIKKDQIKPFMFETRNLSILKRLSEYFRNLSKDIKKRRTALKMFSVYYETLAEAVKNSSVENERMLQPAYIDSIYHAINFEDFRNLNEDGFGVDLHVKGKWLRMETAKHLKIDMPDIWLRPIREIRAAIQKGGVEAHVRLPEELKEAVEEKKSSPEKVEKAAAVDEPKKEDMVADEFQPPDFDAPVAAPSEPDSDEPVEEDMEFSPEQLEKMEKTSPPPLSAGVVRKNRNKRVLPITESNINVLLIGNKPPRLYPEEDDEE